MAYTKSNALNDKYINALDIKCINLNAWNNQWNEWKMHKKICFKSIV